MRVSAGGEGEGLLVMGGLAAALAAWVGLPAPTNTDAALAALLLITLSLLISPLISPWCE
jgi:hypothetical protein